MEPKCKSDMLQGAERVYQYFGSIVLIICASSYLCLISGVVFAAEITFVDSLVFIKCSVD